MDVLIADEMLPMVRKPRKLISLDNLLQVIKNPAAYESKGIERHDMERVRFKYRGEGRKRCAFMIRYRLEGSSKIETIAKTDCQRNDLYLLSILFLKMCRNIGELEWCNIELTEEFYEMLKTISDEVTIKSSWTITIGVSSDSLQEIIKNESSLFKSMQINGNSVCGQTPLTNEALADMLANMFNLNPDNLLYDEEMVEQVSPLNDKLLRLILATGNVPQGFNLELYTSMFTAEGINNFIQGLGSCRGFHVRPYYHLGTIHEDNLYDVEILIAHYKAKHKVIHGIGSNMECITTPLNTDLTHWKVAIWKRSESTMCRIIFLIVKQKEKRKNMMNKEAYTHVEPWRGYW